SCIYTLSLHDALPISMILIQNQVPLENRLCTVVRRPHNEGGHIPADIPSEIGGPIPARTLGEMNLLVRVSVQDFSLRLHIARIRSEEHTSELQSHLNL